MAARPKPRVARRTAALAVGSLLVLAACTGAPAGSPTGSADAESALAFEMIELAEEEFRAERVDLFVLSPLLSALGIDPMFSRAYTMTTMSRVEEAVARCMDALGFAYAPHITHAYLACTEAAGYAWLNNPSSSRLIGFETAVTSELTAEEEITADRGLSGVP